MRTRLALTLLSLVATTAVAAQEHAHDPDQPVQGGGTLPPGWMARTDNNASLSGVKFETMAPGWHITMGPAAILYRENDRATGPVHAIAKIHLFPGSGHAEGFGLFLGGQHLQDSSQAYTYFLIRGDGKFLVKRRTGGTTSTIVEWTDSPAINQAKADGPVANELSFEVTGDSVAFVVNGQRVYAAAAGEVDTKGVIGLRVNHNLSLHVESLGVHPR